MKSELFVSCWILFSNLVYHLAVTATIASRYRISKYPTLKLFRHGEMVKKEYRGQRSAEALANFIRDELRDSVVEHDDLGQLKELDVRPYGCFLLSV